MFAKFYNYAPSVLSIDIYWGIPQSVEFFTQRPLLFPAVKSIISTF